MLKIKINSTFDWGGITVGITPYFYTCVCVHHGSFIFIKALLFMVRSGHDFSIPLTILQSVLPLAAVVLSLTNLIAIALSCTSLRQPTNESHFFLRSRNPIKMSVIPFISRPGTTTNPRLPESNSFPLSSSTTPTAATSHLDLVAGGPG